MAIVSTRYKRVLIGVAGCRSSSMPASSAGGGGEGPRGREPPRRHAAANVAFDNSIAQSCRSAIGQTFAFGFSRFAPKLGHSADCRCTSEADIVGDGPARPLGCAEAVPDETQRIGPGAAVTEAQQRRREDLESSSRAVGGRLRPFPRHLTMDCSGPRAAFRPRADIIWCGVSTAQICPSEPLRHTASDVSDGSSPV
jgi:hypothetical protein